MGVVVVGLRALLYVFSFVWYDGNVGGQRVQGYGLAMVWPGSARCGVIELFVW